MQARSSVLSLTLHSALCARPHHIRRGVVVDRYVSSLRPPAAIQAGHLVPRRFSAASNR